MSWLAPIMAIAGQQQVAAGMIGAAVAGSLVFSLKAVPGKAWKATKDLFSVTMVVEARAWQRIEALLPMPAAKLQSLLQLDDAYGVREAAIDG